MSLTDKQMAAYLEEGGARCPHCEDGGALESNHAAQSIRCRKCGREWRDLTGIEEDESA